VKYSENKIIQSWVAYLRDRFSLEEGKACQEEVVEHISRGVEFRGVNLWVLIFATLIASLGLNVDSTAVIIGAMLISPIMGPIMGMGLSLGINDFDLMKRSFRNFSLMVIVAVATSTLYFLLSPLGRTGSELLARTEPTTFDVLIALAGGLAGFVAQTRRDRTSTVIPGVAIATALIPPLCTAGFGLATGQWRFFFGAFYLFLINTVFIAVATFLVVRFLKYERKVLLDSVKARRINRLMLAITVLTIVPSVVVGFRMVRTSIFESSADRFVDRVFQFENTRVIERKKTCGRGEQPSRIELLLIGEPLSEQVLENARAQMADFGLRNTQLIVNQSANVHDERVDIRSLQRSYSELLAEKNRRIDELKERLSGYSVTDIEAGDLSREVGAVVDNVAAVSLTKGYAYDTAGAVVDTLLICVVTPADSAQTVDTERLGEWLKIRTKITRVKLFVER